MFQRYHRGGTYHSRNPLAATNPLRSLPLLKPAAVVFGPSWYDGTWNQPKPVLGLPAPAAESPLAPVDPGRELANAEASLREAVRVYDFARREIGEANRRVLRDETPAFIREQIIRAGGITKLVILSAERVRERKSAAFRLFNKRRSELAAAKRRLAAARAGLPIEAEAAKSAGQSRRLPFEPSHAPSQKLGLGPEPMAARNAPGASTLINRNVVARTGRTSVRLEPEFWDALHDIARRRGLTLSAVVQAAEQPSRGLTSAVRVFVLGFYRHLAGGRDRVGPS